MSLKYTKTTYTTIKRFEKIEKYSNNSSSDDSDYYEELEPLLIDENPKRIIAYHKILNWMKNCCDSNYRYHSVRVSDLVAFGKQFDKYGYEFKTTLDDNDCFYQGALYLYCKYDEVYEKYGDEIDKIHALYYSLKN